MDRDDGPRRWTATMDRDDGPRRWTATMAPVAERVETLWAHCHGLNDQ
jgi:hypothetical protein